MTAYPVKLTGLREDRLPDLAGGHAEPGPYVARRPLADLSPHAVVGAAIGKLRATLGRCGVGGLMVFSAAGLSVARMYDFLLGDNDLFVADRVAARTILETVPEAALIARTNRAFHACAVRRAARQRITPFIGLGVGPSAAHKAHETIGQVNPAVRTVHVDPDKLVLAYGHALLAVDDQVAMISDDIRDPAATLTTSALTAALIDMTPVCRLFVPVLYFLLDGKAYRAEISPGYLDGH
jgi:S-adenosyl methyltransferase